MSQIIPGVYHLELPLLSEFLPTVNVYIIRGNGKSLLIDTGLDTEESFASFEKQLAEIGMSPKDIGQIVSTHAHGDHYGMASRLKALSQAKVTLHYLEKAASEEMANTDNQERFHMIDTWFRLNGAPPFPPDEFNMVPQVRNRYLPRVTPDIILKGDETISVGDFNLKVVWTPGHAPGHISLYEPARKLFFSGDFVLPTITPNISFRARSEANPLGDFIKSLNMARQFDVDLVLPAHGKPFHDLEKRINETIDHHERRNREIIETIKTQPKTAWQIAGGVTWMVDMGGVKWEDLAPLDRRMAVMETLAHLEYMRLNGRVNRFTNDEIVYYLVPEQTN